MSEPYLGEIKLFSFPFAPRGYAFCNGQLMAINQNQALFSLLGVVYGGDGTTTFALPNMQGRTPMHVGSTPQGTMDGQGGVTLTVQTMPVHTHLVSGTSATATKRPPTGHIFANDTSSDTDFFTAPANLVPLSSQSISPSGGTTPHENMQPYIVLNFCIAISGIFPSRN